MKIFVDSNVLLDTLLKRGKYHEECSEILRLLLEKQVEGAISSSGLLNVFYFLKKSGLPFVALKETASILLNAIQITQTTKKAFIEALESGFLDIEDGVQYRSAIHEDDIEYFETSNVGDLKKSTPELPVITPGDFVHKFHA